MTNGSGGGNLSFGTITTIDVSSLNSEIIAVGTDDSNILVTENGGAIWNNISDNLPNYWTTKVLLDRFDDQTIYATFSGYRYAAEGSHVFRSTNLGGTWEDIGIGLPSIPVNDIVKDGNGTLYVATDIGVFFSEDEGGIWEPLGSNLPNVVVTDLHIDEQSDLLYAATYGRSSYKIDIQQDVSSTEDNQLAAEIEVFPNPTSTDVQIKVPMPYVLEEVNLYDTNGRLCKVNKDIGNQISMDVSGLVSGVYYLKILVNDRVLVKSIVVN